MQLYNIKTKRVSSKCQIFFFQFSGKPTILFFAINIGIHAPIKVKDMDHKITYESRFRNSGFALAFCLPNKTQQH